MSCRFFIMCKMFSLFLCFSFSVFAKVPVSENMIFLGSEINGVFHASDFELKEKNGNIEIKLKNNGHIYKIKNDFDKVCDLVISSNHSAFAILLRYDKKDNIPTRYRLISLNSNNKIRDVFYSPRSIEGFNGDWIVELGSVSKKGAFILVKVAFLEPVASDMKRKKVRHQWIVAKMQENRFLIAEGSAAVDLWENYLDK